jgi:hypothetical protein
MATDCILAWNDVAIEANRVSHTDGNKEQNGPASQLARHCNCAFGDV